MHACVCVGLSLQAGRLISFREPRALRASLKYCFFVLRWKTAVTVLAINNSSCNKINSIAENSRCRELNHCPTSSHFWTSIHLLWQVYFCWLEAHVNLWVHDCNKNSFKHQPWPWYLFSLTVRPSRLTCHGWGRPAQRLSEGRSLTGSATFPRLVSAAVERRGSFESQRTSS